MRVNFDANASVKPLPEVLNYLACYSGEFLNPSSVHLGGQAAKGVLDEARAELSQLLSLSSEDRIIFTSGATEANNSALIPLCAPAQSQYPDLACSNVEHSAVLECLRSQLDKGYKLKEIAVERIEDDSYLSEQIDDNLRIFGLMLANNETGQIFNVKSVADKIRLISPRSKIHCDAAQAVGKIKVNFAELGVDSISISGHKIGALSGIGALVISKYCQIKPLLFGGPQEYGLRAGTENVLGIKSLAIACKAARERILSNDRRMIDAKNKFANYLKSLSDSAVINNFGLNNLPNTLSVRFPGIKADDLVVALDLNGVAVSAGSACASGRPSPSHVLLSHGLSKQEAKETIRISFEPNITETEFEFGLNIFKETIARMINLRRAA